MFKQLYIVLCYMLFKIHVCSSMLIMYMFQKYKNNKKRPDNYTFIKANNKGADQTAQMRRLVCAFVVR